MQLSLFAILLALLQNASAVPTAVRCKTALFNIEQTTTHLTELNNIMHYQNEMRVKLQEDAQSCWSGADGMNYLCRVSNSKALQDLHDRHKLALAQQEEGIRSIAFWELESSKTCKQGGGEALWPVDLVDWPKWRVRQMDLVARKVEDGVRTVGNGTQAMLEDGIEGVGV